LEWVEKSTGTRIFLYKLIGTSSVGVGGKASLRPSGRKGIGGRLRPGIIEALSRRDRRAVGGALCPPR
jgi:hypothetical protein